MAANGRVGVNTGYWMHRTSKWHLSIFYICIRTHITCVCVYRLLDAQDQQVAPSALAEFRAGVRPCSVTITEHITSLVAQGLAWYTLSLSLSLSLSLTHTHVCVCIYIRILICMCVSFSLARACCPFLSLSLCMCVYVVHVCVCVCVCVCV